MKTLIIDNYDSFTYNLFHLIGSLTKNEPTVITNDQYKFTDIDFSLFDNIVISPGPGSPFNKKDIGMCIDVLTHVNLPILGVCLGHQALGQAYGATIQQAPQIIHGESRIITHTSSPLFTHISRKFNAIRYHSLVIDKKTLPNCLAITATSSDVIMGIKHTTKPLYGVQFHPESIGSEYGKQLMHNFNTITKTYRHYENK